MEMAEAERLIDAGHGSDLHDLAPASGASGGAVVAQRGWIAASVAIEVWVTVASTCFLPLALEALARGNGVLAPDRILPCSAAPEPRPGETEALRCVVQLAFGVYLDTASFALYTYSISVVVQALSVISIGAMADRSASRHRLFVAASLVGSSAGAVFFLVPAHSFLWPASALLAIIASVGIAVTTVCLNSWLPHLARPHGDAQAVAHLSARGVAFGNGAGVLALAASLVPVSLLGGSTFSLQLIIGVGGASWLALSAIAARWLPSRSELGEGHRSSLADGWRALFAVLRDARELSQAAIFLAAWALLSDGVGTITSVAILFGRTSLGLPPEKLVLVAILASVSGAIGAISWAKVAARLGVRDSLNATILLVLFALMIPGYGILGLLPVFRSPTPPSFGGLRTEGELYVLAIVFGLIYGPFVANARSAYALLIPSNQSGRWFALWAITDKSSSFLGPMLVGALVDATGEIRAGFCVIGTLLILALPALASVRLDRGIEQARRAERTR